MKAKLTTTDLQTNKQQTLHIHFNDEGKAIVGKHTPEESKQIIKNFVEASGIDFTKLNFKPAQGKILSCVKPFTDQKEDVKTITITSNAESTFGESNWHGEKFIVDDGTLKLRNDINPVIEIKRNSLIIYDGFTVDLPKQQYENIKNAMSEGTQIVFDMCYMNEDISLGRVSVGINGGAYNKVIFDDGINTDECIENRTTIEVINGAHLDAIAIGKANHLNVNCRMVDETDLPVDIDHVEIHGTASLYRCNIGVLVVDKTAVAEVCCDVNHMCCSGTAYICKGASVGTIHLHAGGRIYGEDLNGIDITTDRSFRTYIENGKTWIIA